MATKKAESHWKIEDLMKQFKGKLHLHKPPKCAKGKHDSSCPAGGEVMCRELHVPGHDNNVCACWHVKL